MLSKVLFMMLLLLILVGVGACLMLRSDDHVTYSRFSPLQEELPVLDFTAPSVSTPSMEAYLAFYHLVFPSTEHRWGTFESEEYVLAAHIFTPRHPVGTVFILHGYLDHTGMLHHVIQNCLEQQFVVAVYDLPGHGLSSGERAGIHDFSDYVSVFHDFISMCQAYVPPPYYLISHSTGSAIAFEYLATMPQSEFTGIVFLAPLIHHAHWLLLKTIHALGKPLPIRFVPRRYPRNDADPGLVELLKTDPLQTDRVPVSWVSELYEWDHEIQDAAVIDFPVLIVQGTDDKVVDWKYNLSFLQKKMPRAHIKLVGKAGHYLINEMPDVRAEVFRAVNVYLRNSAINISQN